MLLAPVICRFLLVLCLTSWGMAQAQPLPPVFDPSLRSGEEPPPMREEYKPKIPPPRDILPPAPQVPLEEPGPGLRQPQVFVKEIRVEGSTVFSPERLQEVTDPFEGRTLTTADLERLRVALTRLYIDEGYITSGAVIPDQIMEDGVVRVRVIEGELSRISVEGTEWFRPSFLERRV